MIVYLKNAGNLEVNEGKIGIGDPGYSEVDYKYDVVPGNYKCISYTGRQDGWGTRVWMSQIVLNNDKALELADDDKNWEEGGLISVDAGLAGYFVNKPTFSEENHWLNFCDYTYKKKNHPNNIYDTCLVNNCELFKTPEEKAWNGFWTGSGIGDGLYPVYKLKNSEGQIIGLKLNFA